MLRYPRGGWTSCNIFTHFVNFAQKFLIFPYLANKTVKKCLPSCVGVVKAQILF